MKRRYPTYDICMTLNDDEGNLYDVELEVEADCVYEPAYISGLPENCYQDSSYCEILKVTVLDGGGKDEDWLKSLITDSDMERIEEIVWEEFRA